MNADCPPAASQDCSRLSADWLSRFRSIERLYGSGSVARLARANVAVVGLGGVGSWVVESLVRSGIGAITLMDLDDVCVTNTARQLPALVSTVGQPKVEVLARRVSEINPECAVHRVHRFFTAATRETLLNRHYDVVVDAIDRYSHKLALLGHCHQARQPVITCGAAGGRRDPTLVRVTDLGAAGQDPLLKQLRRGLRREFEFTKGEGTKFGIPCVASSERPLFPWSDGTVRLEEEPGCTLGLDCATGFGAASYVTGVFGLMAARTAVHLVLGLPWK